MISQFFKFIVVNNSGPTLTYDTNGRLNLKVTRYYTDPTTGKVTYDAETDDGLGFGAGDSTVDGGEDVSSEYDNTSDLDIGLKVQLEVTHDEGTAADGTFDIYFLEGDATGELPDDASGYDDAETNKLDFLGSLTWHASGADDEVMRSDTFDIR